MNHQDAVTLIQQEIENGSPRSDTLKDCLQRGENLNIFLRRLVANNFCVAIIDITAQHKPRCTWTFDLADCPIIFAFFKEKGILAKVLLETVRIALDTLEQIRVQLEVETSLNDIIHEALRYPSDQEDQP